MLLARCGNAEAAAHYEAGGVPAGARPRPDASLPELERFARRKYLDREWAAGQGAWPPTPVREGVARGGAGRRRGVSERPASTVQARQPTPPDLFIAALPARPSTTTNAGRPA